MQKIKFHQIYETFLRTVKLPYVTENDIHEFQVNLKKR